MKLALNCVSENSKELKGVSMTKEAVKTKMKD